MKSRSRSSNPRATSGNKRILLVAVALLASAVLVIGAGLAVYLGVLPLSTSNIPIAGPEGPQAWVYGAQIENQGTPGPMLVDGQPGNNNGFYWSQTGQFEATLTHRQQGTPPCPTYSSSASSLVCAFNAPGPNWWYQNGQGNLLVESTLPDVPYTSPNGAGLQGWTQNQPAMAENDTFYSFKAQNISVTSTGYTTQYTLVQNSILYLPIDFVIQVSAMPVSTPFGAVYTFGQGGSQAVILWFQLNTVEWLNTFPNYFTKPVTCTTTTQVNCVGDNAQVLTTGSGCQTQIENTYCLRGAFPIMGWIEGSQPWNFYSKDQTGKNNSGIINVLDTSGSALSTPSNFPSSALSYVNVQPSLGGRILELSTQPSMYYNLTSLEASNYQTASLTAEAQNIVNGVTSPPYAPQTVYFPLTVENMGPYVQDTGNYGETFTCVDISYCSYNTWYPSAYYHIRVLYGFYGQWTYLWTVQRDINNQGPSPFTTNSQGQVVSSGNYQNRTSVEEIHVPATQSALNAAWNGLGEWASQYLGLPATIAGWVLIFLAVMLIGGVFFVVWIFLAKRVGVRPSDIRDYGSAGRRNPG